MGTAIIKTVTGAAIIARRRVNTLIPAHRTELLRQWQERLNALLDIGKGVTIVRSATTRDVILTAFDSSGLRSV